MKWGYGLTFFGILGFISTMTNEETRTLQYFLFTLCCVILGLFLIIKNDKRNIHNNKINNNMKTNNQSYKYIKETVSAENIVYPIHIKYKNIKIEVKKRTYQNEKLNFWHDILYPTYETPTNQPVYNCILNGKIVGTLSCGQEMDLDVIPGEYVIFFELANSLTRIKVKNK